MSKFIINACWSSERWGRLSATTTLTKSLNSGRLISLKLKTQSWYQLLSSILVGPSQKPGPVPSKKGAPGPSPEPPEPRGNLRTIWCKPKWSTTTSTCKSYRVGPTGGSESRTGGLISSFFKCLYAKLITSIEKFPVDHCDVMETYCVTNNNVEIHNHLRVQSEGRFSENNHKLYQHTLKLTSLFSFIVRQEVLSWTKNHLMHHYSLH